ncbi:hypothetical protein BCR44DRAFT_1008938 [Catenaria anguillulae PL171]|uniref:Uncharacterized protein n=1 Tax=Catenaria anguillulae PL171 TaxID=765915 RepID=A0A1Y2I670_9FUNG|nr:hypothetical protein BCR44DRAFT_1008938 [Catenaria anguillulae PL171]
MAIKPSADCHSTGRPTNPHEARHPHTHTPSYSHGSRTVSMASGQSACPCCSIFCFAKTP